MERLRRIDDCTLRSVFRSPSRSCLSPSARKISRFIESPSSVPRRVQDGRTLQLTIPQDLIRPGALRFIHTAGRARPRRAAIFICFCVIGAQLAFLSFSSPPSVRFPPFSGNMVRMPNCHQSSLARPRRAPKRPPPRGGCRAKRDWGSSPLCRRRAPARPAFVAACRRGANRVSFRLVATRKRRRLPQAFP